MTLLTFLLADPDRGRAEAIAASLAGFRGVSVVKSGADLSDRLASRSIILAADEPGVIQRVLGRIKETGSRAKIIAYASEPSHHQMVKAMAAGAADYLSWPCDPANIIAAANAATAEALG